MQLADMSLHTVVFVWLALLFVGLAVSLRTRKVARAWLLVVALTGLIFLGGVAPPESTEVAVSEILVSGQPSEQKRRVTVSMTTESSAAMMDDGLQIVAQHLHGGLEESALSLRRRRGEGGAPLFEGEIELAELFPTTKGYGEFAIVIINRGLASPPVGAGRAQFLSSYRESFERAPQHVFSGGQAWAVNSEQVLFVDAIGKPGLPARFKQQFPSADYIAVVVRLRLQAPRLPTNSSTHPSFYISYDDWTTLVLGDGSSEWASFLQGLERSSPGNESARFPITHEVPQLSELWEGGWWEVAFVWQRLDSDQVKLALVVDKDEMASRVIRGELPDAWSLVLRAGNTRAWIDRVEVFVDCWI